MKANTTNNVLAYLLIAYDTFTEKWPSTMWDLEQQEHIYHVNVQNGIF